MIKEEGKTVEGNPCWSLNIKGAWSYGCYVEEEQKIYVWAVNSDIKGGFKKIMNTLVEHFKTNKFKFTNIINLNLVKILHGFKLQEEYWEVAGENILCLDGEWKT